MHNGVLGLSTLTGPTLQQPVVDDGIVTPGSRSFPAAASSDSFLVAPTAPPPPIYVGNVQLTTNSHSFDKIAAAFHNSSRKILSFVPPTMW
ncbi:UNVERIFIED_CONTAM: hypothetical protein Sradi_1890800 [Sesamum radiatum]|uniref:Uncharacterized protein n=1 Tax=Sesamum radiatum TaxID=300843 RepID=A0AAW2TYF4_SESRA